jgi:hypothetical protein
MAENKEGKHIQKWIGCSVTDEEFEAHNSKRKELGQTWAEYMMPMLAPRLTEDKPQVTVVAPPTATVEGGLPANRDEAETTKTKATKGSAKGKKRKEA